MKVGRDIFFSLPYTLKFIFNELDIQCKGQKEMLVKINIKDVFLGGYVEQTRKHYEMVFEVVGIDDSGCCHVQVRATFSILLMDLLVSRKYRKEISGFILIETSSGHATSFPLLVNKICFYSGDVMIDFAKCNYFLAKPLHNLQKSISSGPNCREPSYSREIAYKWAWVAEMLIQILDKITLWNM
ncbi:hypothetical protein NC653_003066 [Populus alba x Populus x berolinensis]|uniref:Uncharacterized protein n=1 Tax=Populus alba x Populus x berolinensis TaxID=444605 RepID=A0AAD6WI70_9ROSI|nr:hypothetical protein NC653_003066 [Populus alba x Populus x berolinensis]